MTESHVLWHQSYMILGQGLGVSALLAALPIFTLLFLLGALRKAAWLAGLLGLAVALVIAIAGYGMPAQSAVSAALYGAAFGLFPICWIIYWAIALFRVTVETGKFEIIRDSVAHLTPDPRLQILLVAFCFGAFLEGGAGFGTPVAVAATMLTGLGFSAFSASASCLLANTAPVAFGAIGIPVITLAATTGLPLNKLSGEVALLCAPAALIIPTYLLVAMGGFKTMRGLWFPAISSGLIFAGVQIGVSAYMGPQLSSILSALASMLALILIVRLRGDAKKPLDNSEEHGFGALTRERVHAASSTPSASASASVLILETSTRPAPGKILYAWLPYLLLVACVVLWGIAPAQRILNLGSITIAWPLLHNLVLIMPPVSSAPLPYGAIFKFNIISAAGTACMVATVLSAACLKVTPPRFISLLWSVTRQLALPIVTIALVLAIGFLMNYSGATATLGLAFASSGKLFPFFSPLLGLLGVFLTGSDTSSNALFGNLQVVTAGRLGLDPLLMAAANAAGGVMGKMISVQSIAVAAAATGLSVLDQARLFRFTLKHSIYLGILVGCIVMFYVYALRI